jgi:hypothetical protein
MASWGGQPWPCFQVSLALESFHVNWTLLSLANSARLAQAILALNSGQKPRFISYFSNMQTNLVYEKLALMFVPLVNIQEWALQNPSRHFAMNVC